MAIPLRVLLVEDSDDDAFLLARELRRGGYDATITRVADAEAMRAALARPDFDIVLADYYMPLFSGQAALELARALVPDIPLIVVSATIGEETAVAMVKAGAHDYVMKGKLNRLAPAIERARRESEARRERARAEQALRESEEKFRSLIENALDVITVADVTSKVVYESPSVERVFGYRPEELIGTTGLSRVHPDDVARVAKVWQEVVAHPGETRQVECRQRHKDGSWRTIEALGRVIVDPAGQKLFIVNARDITERRRAELALRASEEKFRSLVENTVDVISVRDATGRVIFESPSAESVFGFTPEELVGQTGFDRIHPDDVDRVMQTWQDALAHPGKTYRVECRMRHKDGSWLSIEAIGLGVVDSNGQMQILVSIRDTSERQRAEAALRESEEKFRGFIEQSNDGVVILDADMRIIEWSRGQQQIFGFTRDEMIGRRGWEYQYQVLPEADRTPEMLERLQRNLDHISRDQPPAQLMRPREIQVQTRDGQLKYVQVSAFPIRTSTGMRFGSITRDVTERRQAEQALRDSEDKFRRFVEQSTDGIVLVDQQMRVTEWSAGQAAIFGYSREEMLGRPLWEYQFACLPLEHRTDEMRQRLQQAVREMASGLLGQGAAPALELEVVTRAGARRIVQISAFPIQTAAGTIYGSITRDVTERRQAEQALREREQQLRSITDNMLDMISTVDIEGHLTYVSPSTTKNLGYLPEQLLGVDYLELVHPEDRARVLESAIHIVSNRTQGTSEYRYRHVDGHYVWLETMSTVLLDEAGAVLGAVNASRDVTDRRRAEQALREREEFYRSLIENTLDLISEFNMEGTLTYVSPSIERVFGFRPADVVGRNLSKLGLDRADLERVTSDIMVSPPHEIEGRRYEVRIQHQDGSWRWIEALVRIVPQLDRDPRFVVNARDISARKEGEQALRSSEEKYRRLVESLGAEYFFYRHDASGVFTYLSPSVTDMLGYTQEEFAVHYTQYLTDNPVNRGVVTHTDGSLRGEQQPPYDLEIRHRAGGTRWLEVTEVPLRAADGQVVGVEGIAHDITVRKQTERAVRQTRDYLDQIINSIGDPVFVKDRQHRFALVNDAMIELLGIPREEWIGASDADFFPPEQVAVFLEKDEQVFVTGEPNTNEEQLTGADGRVRTIVTKKSRLIDAAGNMFIVGVIRDVTLQREYERAVKAQADSMTAI